MYSGLAPGCANSPVLGYNAGLDSLFFRTLSVHCINDIILVGVNEEDMAGTLEVRYMHFKGWGRNLMKIQGSDMFLGIQAHLVSLHFTSLHFTEVVLFPN